MGFRGEEKSLKVRSRGVIAAQLFRQAALKSAYIQNQSGPQTYNGSSYRRLINPVEYAASTTHITASSVESSAPRGEKGSGGSIGNYNPPSNMYHSNVDYSKIYDISGYSNLRGFLQPLTLREFVTARNCPQTATRVFYKCWADTGARYENGLTWLFDSTTKKPFNEFERYTDKIVPVITWYFDNANGERVSNYQILGIHKWFTTNQYEITEYKNMQVPFGGGYTRGYVAKTQNISDIGYFSISAPYVSSKTGTYENRTGEGAVLNGAVFTKWGDGDTAENIVAYDETAFYTMLSVGYADTATTAALYNVSGSEYVGAAVPYAVGNPQTKYYVPVFDSVDDIIRLFDDFGVVVTTDWDEVLNPTPTPEEAATPNPDPTDKEIPNFPDNTTDTTPIEPAYITPSSFGRSCVYNPTTTQDFLRWICDNTVDIANWSRLFANPVDVITGISLYNLDIPARDTAHVSYNSETNILGVATNIPNYSILGGYNNIVDGGTLHLTAYYGNYADFTSMTYQMYVPFAGFVTLRACDVVNRTLHLYYAVDFATGAAVAFVNSDDRLIYTTPCTVAGKIPISTSDKNSQMINNTLSVLGGLGGLLGGIASGNVGGGVGSLFSGLGGLQFQTNYANKGSVSAVNMYKLIPAFVERTRYDLFLPSNDSNYISAKYQNIAGAPSTQFDTLLNCVDAGGFVQSDVVYITSQTATETEKQQIIDLIKSGIYL